MSYSNSPDSVNRRHLAGFRKFQRAALRALDAALAVIDETAAPAEAIKAKDRPVKPTDMKPLVATYHDAVVGERMVLGMEKPGPAAGPGSADWPTEVTVRWVDDDEQEPEAVSDIP